MSLSDSGAGVLACPGFAPAPNSDAAGTAAPPLELSTRLRAASAAIAAWFAAPSDAAWDLLRQQVNAMEAYLPACRHQADAEVERETAAYRDHLAALRARLLAWDQQLRARRAQLQQSRLTLEGVRAWRDSLETIALEPITPEVVAR